MSQIDITEKAIRAYHEYKEKQSEGTAREYRRHIRRFRDYLKEHTERNMWNCHSGHTESFYQWMKDTKGYSPSSVRVSHAALCGFYDKVDKFGGDGRRGFPNKTPEQDPTEHSSPERLEGMHKSSIKEIEGGDKPLTEEEVAELIENVPAPTVRNELICRMLYQTGMRRSEIVRVKLDHINQESNHIQVYGKKTEEPRDVWYQPSLNWHLNRWIEAERPAVFHAEDSPYLFPTRIQERMDEQTITDVVKTAAENADLQETVYATKRPESAKEGDKTPEISRVGAHTLRKSFGVHFINNGGDISFLADILGHDDIETTKQSYLQYSKEDKENSVRRHGPSV